MTKPSTADPQVLRHSMPALCYHSSSEGSSRKQSGKQHKGAATPQRQHQQQRRAQCNSLGAGPLPVLGLLGPCRNSPSPTGSFNASNAYSSSSSWAGGGWPPYISPPRITGGPTGARGGRSHISMAAGRMQGPRLDGCGSASLGPSTVAQLFPSSLRQELSHAGAAGLTGEQCCACMPAWCMIRKFSSGAASCRTSQCSSQLKHLLSICCQPHGTCCQGKGPQATPG